MSGDYGIGSPNGAAAVFPKLRDSAPDPQGANAASRAFSKAKLPTGQINTKGGTHFEYSVIPNPGFAATLRGLDQAAWYTIAWFDKYLSHAERADRLLLTNRWQKDAENKRVDPQGDANLYSKDLRSRIDVRRSDGSRALCEDLRAGCGILVDDRAGPFSAVGFGLGQREPPRDPPGPLRHPRGRPQTARPLAREAAPDGEAAPEPAHEGGAASQAPRGPDLPPHAHARRRAAVHPAEAPSPRSRRPATG